MQLPADLKPTFSSIEASINLLLTHNLTQNILLTGGRQTGKNWITNMLRLKFKSIKFVEFDFKIQPKATVPQIFQTHSLQTLQQMQKTKTVVIYNNPEAIQSQSTIYILSELAVPPSQFLQIFCTRDIHFLRNLRPRIRSRLRCQQFYLRNEPETDWNQLKSIAIEGLYLITALTIKPMKKAQLAQFMKSKKVDQRLSEIGEISLNWLVEAGFIVKIDGVLYSKVSFQEIEEISKKEAYPSNVYYLRLKALFQ